MFATRRVPGISKGKEDTLQLESHDLNTCPTQISYFSNKYSNHAAALKMRTYYDTSQDIEGWLVANQGSVTVALDVTISDALKEEGIARELVNRIQNLRKDSGFELTDRIEVFLQADTQIENAIKQNLDYIKLETLTEELQLVAQLDKGTEVSFDTVNTKLYIQKSK